MATPRPAREGRGLVTFAVAACCTGISFTRIAQALTPQIISTDEAAACGFTVDLHLVISCWSDDFLLEL